MERLKNITEFVVVSNLENRAMNAGINKAQNWWKKHHNHTVPVEIVRSTSAAIVKNPGKLVITILRARDVHESRLSMLTASVPKLERPFVVIECNQQRFQTTQADLISIARNPQWTSGNGPFNFNVINLDADRLTVWIQQQEPLRVVKHNAPKLLAMGEINIRQLIDREQVWLPLRKDNRPVGQVLLQVMFIPREE